MPNTSQGYFPTSNQYALNYTNIIRRNFTPTVIYQNIRKSTPFLQYIMDNCARPRAGGFSPITQPIMTTTFGDNTSYANWNAQFTIPSLTNPLINLEFNQSLTITPFVFSMLELNMMDNKEYVVIDVIKTRLYDAYMQLMITLNNAFLGTQGSNPLAYLGLFDGIDAGTNAPTYGGLSRSTYPKLNATIYTNSQSGAAYAQLMYYIISALNDSNAPMPTFGLIAPSVFMALITSFTNIERMMVQDINNVSDSREYKIQALNIGGIPHIVDPNLAGSTTVYYPNMEHIYFDYDPALNFKMTEAESLSSVGQLAWIQSLTTCGQFYTDLPSAHYAVQSAPSTTLA